MLSKPVQSSVSLDVDSTLRILRNTQQIADLYHELRIKTHLIKEDVNNDSNS